MNKIQRVSKVLRIVFQIAFVLWPLVLAIHWYFAIGHTSTNLLFNFIPEGIIHPISRIEALLGFLIGLIPITIEMTIIYFLTKLFKLYEQGKTFTLSNVEYLHKIGIWMLIKQAVGFFYDALLTFVLSIHNPPGHHFAAFTFSNYDVYNIVIAIMVIVISWIMAEGCKLQEEQKYIV